MTKYTNWYTTRCKKYPQFKKTACEPNLGVPFTRVSKGKTGIAYACRRCGVHKSFAGMRTSPCSKRTTSMPVATLQAWSLGQQESEARRQRVIQYHAKWRKKHPWIPRRTPEETKAMRKQVALNNGQSLIAKAHAKHEDWLATMKRRPQIYDSICDINTSTFRIANNPTNPNSTRREHLCQRCHNYKFMDRTRTYPCPARTTGVTLRQFQTASKGKAYADREEKNRLASSNRSYHKHKHRSKP